MKPYLILTLAVAGIFSWAGLAFRSAAHDNSHEKNAFTPDTISWGAAPPVVRPGAQFAVLEGDPTATTGDYTIRLKMPDGFRIPPPGPRHASLRHGLRRNHCAGPRTISASIQLHQSCRRPRQEQVVGSRAPQGLIRQPVQRAGERTSRAWPDRAES